MGSPSQNSFSTNSLFAPHTQQCVQVETAFQLYSIIFYLWPGGRIVQHYLLFVARWQEPAVAKMGRSSSLSCPMLSNGFAIKLNSC